MKSIVSYLIVSLAASLSNVAAENAIVVDSIHYSEVMGENRHYRIFLPSDYVQNTSEKYSVIYFYHGWSQRYFGSLNRQNSEIQKSAEEELIADLVEQFNVVVVKPDGYNADADDAYYLRPYNIGTIETHRQFALYFPEFVDFIDANYRTIAERDHRGIMGYSMGGFMAFWIAGKYPQLVTAAGSFCGSPEFVIGPKDFPVEYYHGDMYGNYDGVRLRLNYGREDFIRAYHKDLNAIFTNVLENYEVQDYPGGHALSGLEDMFDFFSRSFKYTIPTLSSSVSEGETIDLEVMYWLPDYPDHIEKSGHIRLIVSGVDKTAPEVERVTLKGDNILRARIVDGGKINKVMAELTSIDDPGTVVKIELYDSGKGEDRLPDDYMFTRKIKVPYFGKYTLVLQMHDEFGNSSVRKLPEHYVFFGRDLK